MTRSEFVVTGSEFDVTGSEFDGANSIFGESQIIETHKYVVLRKSYLGENDRYHKLLTLEQKIVKPKEQHFCLSRGRIEVDRLTGDTFLTVERVSSNTSLFVRDLLTPFLDAI